MSVTSLHIWAREDCGPRLDELRLLYGDWFADRLSESSVVYRLPGTILQRLTGLLALTPEDQRAEALLDRICTKCHSVAVTGTSAVPYRWLRPRLAQPRTEWFGSMRALGWTSAHVWQAWELIDKADGMADRVKGAAGRLICCPNFLAARDQLQSRWQALPDELRPELPLYRSPQSAQQPPELQRVSAPPRLKRFTKELDAFCDEWNLQGLATWELPNPQGPKWPVLSPSSEANRQPVVSLETPWHFPVQHRDGCGDVVNEIHSQDATSRGIDDLAHWKTYAHLLELDHWERVIRSRYLDRKKPRGFVTGLEGVLGDLLDLDLDRVRKLRKLLRTLRGGKLRSLAGWR